MSNVVFIGDSVFDNGSYISGGRNVRWQVENSLPKGWQCTLLAVDGNTVRNISDELARLPKDASHLIVSVGGNDAIDQMGVIDERLGSMADALSRMASVREAFQRDYRAMVQEVLKHKLPTGLCTIYYPQFPDPDFQRLAIAGLASFNDIILLEAFRAGLPLLDLRLRSEE